MCPDESDGSVMSRKISSNQVILGQMVIACRHESRFSPFGSCLTADLLTAYRIHNILLRRALLLSVGKGDHHAG